MCGLCGVWRGRSHWATKAQNPRVFSFESSSAELLRERTLQMRALNRITTVFGVAIRDWQGTQWLIEFADGASVVADGVPDIWVAMESHLRRRIDPLLPPLVGRASCAGPAEG